MYAPGEFVAAAINREVLADDLRRAGVVMWTFVTAAMTSILVAMSYWLIAYPAMLAIAIVFTAIAGLTWWVQAHSIHHSPPIVLIARDSYGVSRPMLVPIMRWSRLLLSIAICVVYYFSAPSKVLPQLLIVFGSIACMMVATVVFWDSFGRPFRLAKRIFFLHFWDETASFRIVRQPGRLLLSGESIPPDSDRSAKPTMTECLEMNEEQGDQLCNFIRQRIANVQIVDQRNRSATRV